MQMFIPSDLSICVHLEMLRHEEGLDAWSPEHMKTYYTVQSGPPHILPASSEHLQGLTWIIRLTE